MPISLEELEALRAESFADDVPIPPAATSWSAERATAYFESAGESEKPIECVYEVTQTQMYVNVRASPSVNGKVLSTKAKGERVTVDACGGERDGWLRLVEQFGEDKSETGWLLIDGSSVGHALLMRRVSGPLPPSVNAKGAADPPKTAWEASQTSPPSAPSAGGVVSLVAPMTYELVYPFVKVRQSPETTASEMGMLRKGTQVSVDALKDDWVRLEKADDFETGGIPGTPAAKPDDPAAFGGGWMLTDGRTLKPALGVLLKPHILELPAGTRWQVTRAGGCVGYDNPGGSGARSSDKGRRLAECTEGASVEVTAECGLWARVVTSAGPAWCEMDCFFAG